MIFFKPKGVKHMIEIIYKTEQNKAEGNESMFKIPNNIRQIGEWKGHQKIYIEDYAYTFLKKISRDTGDVGKAAILFGSHNWTEDCSYLFIKSALYIEEMEVSPEHMAFTDKIWGQVYEDGKKYFPGQEIVGWFISLPGYNMQINEVILKNHLNHFAGNEKTLFLVEPGEWEEAFFMYENKQLVRQTGYFIYYEKNEAMQSYMIQMSKNKSIEETEHIPDRAVADFRKTVKEKINRGEKKKKEEKPSEQTGKTDKKDSYTGWLTGACAAAAVLAIGIRYFNTSQGISGIEGKIENETVVSSEETEQVSSDYVDTVIDQELEKEDTVEKENTVEQEEQRQEKEENFSHEEESKEAGTESIEETSGTNMGEMTPSAMQEYMIQPGDTMTSICKNKYGNTQRLEEICQLNGIAAEDIIYAGKKLLLPD